MRIFFIARLSTNVGSHQALRLLDIDSGQVMDVDEAEIINSIKNNCVNIENAVIKNDKIDAAVGNIRDYPKLNVSVDKSKRYENLTKESLILIEQKPEGYLLSDYRGNLRLLSTFDFNTCARVTCIANSKTSKSAVQTKANGKNYIAKANLIGQGIKYQALDFNKVKYYESKKFKDYLKTLGIHEIMMTSDIAILGNSNRSMQGTKAASIYNLKDMLGDKYDCKLISGIPLLIEGQMNVSTDQVIMYVGDKGPIRISDENDETYIYRGSINQEILRNSNYSIINLAYEAVAQKLGISIPDNMKHADKTMINNVLDVQVYQNHYIHVYIGRFKIVVTLNEILSTLKQFGSINIPTHDASNDYVIASDSSIKDTSIWFDTGNNTLWACGARERKCHLEKIVIEDAISHLYIEHMNVDRLVIENMRSIVTCLGGFVKTVEIYNTTRGCNVSKLIKNIECDCIEFNGKVCLIEQEIASGLLKDGVQFHGSYKLC